MPDKTLTYVELAQDTARQITSNYRSWTGYLSTASRLYKYPYSDQLLIHAQRPDATACAEYDLWNNTMRRYVRRGSKGIALLNTSGDQVSLRYVFDIADTGTRQSSRIPFVWTISPWNELAVSAMLEHEYGVSSDHGLSYQLSRIARQRADEYGRDHRFDILRIVDGSFLDGYDELNVGMSFRRAAAASISYVLHSRCGLDVESTFVHGDFLNVFDWNTPDAAAVLGTAISEISGQVLRQIEAIARSVERSLENERNAVHEEGRLPVPQPDRAEAAQPAPEQVRTDAGEVPGGAKADPVPDDAAERDADEPSAGGQRDSEPPSGADDAGNGESGERDGGTENQRSVELDAADERSESTGRGNPAGGTDLQLSFLDTAFAIPTQAEQIHSIEEAERAILAPFAFSVPQEVIDQFLRLGSNTEEHRMAVAMAFMKQKSTEQAADDLREIYHGGNGLTVNGRKYAVWYAEEGLRIAAGTSARYTGAAQTVSWEDAARRIGELLDDGQFAASLELTEAPGYERKQVAEKLWYLRHDFSEEAISQGFLPSLGELHGGGFPEKTAWLAEKLADISFCEALADELTVFRNACQTNQNLLRFHYHRVDDLLTRMEELLLPRRTWTVFIR